MLVSKSYSRAIHLDQAQHVSDTQNDLGDAYSQVASPSAPARNVDKGWLLHLSQLFNHLRSETCLLYPPVHSHYQYEERH
jgi:N-dimethylarginine dimethylaminohydrolase